MSGQEKYNGYFNVSCLEEIHHSVSQAIIWGCVEEWSYQIRYLKSFFHNLSLLITNTVSYLQFPHCWIILCRVSLLWDSSRWFNTWNLLDSSPWSRLSSTHMPSPHLTVIMWCYLMKHECTKMWFYLVYNIIKYLKFYWSFRPRSKYF